MKLVDWIGDKTEVGIAESMDENLQVIGTCDGERPCNRDYETCEIYLAIKNHSFPPNWLFLHPAQFGCVNWKEK